MAEARHPALATRVVAVQALACRVRREFADARPFALLSGRPAIRTERIHEAHNCDSDFQCRSPRVDGGIDSPAFRDKVAANQRGWSPPKTADIQPMTPTAEPRRGRSFCSRITLPSAISADERRRIPSRGWVHARFRNRRAAGGPGAATRRALHRARRSGQPVQRHDLRERPQHQRAVPGDAGRLRDPGGRGRRPGGVHRLRSAPGFWHLRRSQPPLLVGHDRRLRAQPGRGAAHGAGGKLAARRGADRAGAHGPRDPLSGAGRHALPRRQPHGTGLGLRPSRGAGPDRRRDRAGRAGRDARARSGVSGGLRAAGGARRVRDRAAAGRAPPCRVHAIWKWNLPSRWRRGAVFPGNTGGTWRAHRWWPQGSPTIS